MEYRSVASLTIVLALLAPAVTLATACSSGSGKEDPAATGGEPQKAAPGPEQSNGPPQPSPPQAPLTYACSAFLGGSTEIERFAIDFAKSGLSERRLVTPTLGRQVTFGWSRVIVRDGAAPRILLSLEVESSDLGSLATSNATGDPELLDISAGSRNPADPLADKPLALVSCERK